MVIVLDRPLDQEELVVFAISKNRVPVFVQLYRVVGCLAIHVDATYDGPEYAECGHAEEALRGARTVQ